MDLHDVHNILQEQLNLIMHDVIVFITCARARALLPQHINQNIQGSEAFHIRIELENDEFRTTPFVASFYGTSRRLQMSKTP